VCARETPRREIVHIFRVYPPPQRPLLICTYENFFFIKHIQSDVCARERPRGERSFTFSESTYPPAQRRVRLSSIESFVLNAATAADEQRRPRKINSCFYKTPTESCGGLIGRVVWTVGWFLPVVPHPVVVWEVVVNKDCEMWSHRGTGSPGRELV
jgi:hypothetical protein